MSKNKIKANRASREKYSVQVSEIGVPDQIIELSNSIIFKQGRLVRSNLFSTLYFYTCVLRW